MDCSSLMFFTLCHSWFCTEVNFVVLVLAVPAFNALRLLLLSPRTLLVRSFPPSALQTAGAVCFSKEDERTPPVSRKEGDLETSKKRKPRGDDGHFPKPGAPSKPSRRRSPPTLPSTSEPLAAAPTAASTALAARQTLERPIFCAVFLFVFPTLPKRPVHL